MSAAATRAALAALALALLAGCASVRPYDYTAFHEHPPRSILILPPLNESTAVEATYSYLSTVSRPVAERGYYVFPVAVIDQLLKDNGLPTAGEMHDVPLARIREVTGADAVLYPVLHDYGSKYHIVSTDTIVRVSARLVDTRTGTLLWEGDGTGRQGTGNSGNLLANAIAALVVQAVNSNSDPAHGVCRLANVQLFDTRSRELPFGPYHPSFGKSP